MCYTIQSFLDYCLSLVCLVYERPMLYQVAVVLGVPFKILIAQPLWDLDIIVLQRIENF